MKEKSIISVSTLAVSLFTYWYARANNKVAAPYVMIGGFTGSIIGETIVEKIKQDRPR